MLIGTSLGRCLTSILHGDVDINDVACIITRTRAETWDKMVMVVKEYHEYGNNRMREYDLGQFEWDKVIDVAHQLWHSGRIHQPRNYTDRSTGGLLDRPSFPYQDLWLEIIPTTKSTTPAVVEAYEHYRMLRILAGENVG